MDEKPGIVKFTPHSTSRSAMLIAVAVTVGVQVALCAVLVAIHLQDMWFPSVQGGEVEMTFVSPSEEVSQEMEEVQPTSVVPVAAPSTVSPVPEIASDEDLLAMKLPENEDCSEMKDFLLDEAPSELLPEELAAMRISMNEVKRRQPVKRPAVSLPGRPEPDQNISPDKKVRYKHAPSLPNSVNSSKVGKVNAVVKVVVGVNSHGEPSSVNGKCGIGPPFYALGERELDFLSGGKGRCAHCFQGGGARQAEYRLTCTRKYKDASGEDRE